MTVDRAALIEAATEAAQRIVASPQFNTNAVQRTVDAVLVATVMPAALDAVLPLIADAIEDPIRHGEAVHYEFCSLAQAGALVRSLLGTDGDR